MRHPTVELRSLDTLWFQVTGTLCNLECSHCFISSGPGNHAFEFLSVEEVHRHLEDSRRYGVKEYYFTGGEPFLHPGLLEILEATLAIGPATVLTNGTLLPGEVVRRLAALDAGSIYSLEIRVSLDAFTPGENDRIRGAGVFARAMEAVRRLVDAGLLPIVTVMRSWDEAENRDIFGGFVDALKAIGYARPRIKMLPSLKLGREVQRTRGYRADEVVTGEMLRGYDVGQLMCSSTRMITRKGVYVCPILIEAPDARLGGTLGEALGPYPLAHRACYSCYIWGAVCNNVASVARDA